MSAQSQKGLGPQQQIQNIQASGISISQTQSQTSGGNQKQSFITGGDRDYLTSEVLESLEEIKVNIAAIIKNQFAQLEKIDNTIEKLEILDSIAENISKLLDKQDLTEDYLKDKLGNDWEKIKGSWEDYKNGKVDKKGLIKRGIKALGKKFIII